MAKRAKSKIDDNLFAKTTEESKRPVGQKTAAWRVGADVIDRVNAAAEERRAQKGDLVRVLLIYALDALDAGDLALTYEDYTGPRRLKT